MFLGRKSPFEKAALQNPKSRYFKPFEFFDHSRSSAKHPRNSKAFRAILVESSVTTWGSRISRFKLVKAKGHGVHLASIIAVRGWAQLVDNYLNGRRMAEVTRRSS